MKKILVYPCGTEIGLEVYRSLCYSTHYEIYGGSCSYDHGRFVFKNHIDKLPFITDMSTAGEVDAFNEAIAGYSFDFIYPAMDGIVNVFSKFKEHLTPTVLAPVCETTEITRSKRKTYEILNGIVPIPEIYDSKEAIMEFPVFVKPDVGQGSVGAKMVNSIEDIESIDFKQYLCLEWLPGEEYTVDCFTNSEGKLIYAKGRGRKRIKNGISVNAVFVDNPLFIEYAEKINKKIKQKGGWFYQVKEARDGTLKLLEVASRIAGTSAITRCIGINLPLLTVNLFDGFAIDDLIANTYDIELDRALQNVYKVRLSYGTVYFDYDDTFVERGIINTQMIKFAYQCVNHGIKLVLLSKHVGDLNAELARYHMVGLFDEIIQIERERNKYEYITSANAIFIDDSFGERRMVREKCGIPVFDTHMVECLLED